MKPLRMLAVAATASAILAQALMVPGAAGARNTLPGQVLIVTLNIEEAYQMGTNDLADMFEIPNFVKRVIPGTPHLPDVFLMQEVNYRSSGYLARELTRRTGQRYVVAVRPTRNTTIEYPDKQVHTETGIIINATTMRVLRKGPYVATGYPRSAAAPGVRRKIRRHAHALLKERGTGLRVPIMSVHFARTGDMRSKRISNYYRGEWAEKIESLMQRKYYADHPSRVSNVGGDFNMGRCAWGEFKTCRIARFWKIFTSAPHRYRDSLWELKLPTGVDIIFTTGRVLDGGWDQNGNFDESNRRNYYSDHRFRWLLLDNA